MDALTSRKRLTCVAVAASLCIAASAANARIVKITIDSTTPVSSGAQFGTVGAYELHRGTAFGEIDPADRRNNGITDITLAPKNANGKVEYKTQFAIHKPVDMTKASGVMVYNVPNRGDIAIPYTAGDTSFLWRRGDVVLNSAWQGDHADRVGAGERSSASTCRSPSADGCAVAGMVVDRFVAVAAQTGGAQQTTQSLPGPGRDLASIDTAKSTLDLGNQGIADRRQDRRGHHSRAPTSRSPIAAPCRSPARPIRRGCASRAASIPALLYELVRHREGSVRARRRQRRRCATSSRSSATRTKDDAGTANPIAGAIKYGDRLRQLAVGPLPEAHAEQRLQRGRGRQDRLGRHEPEHRRDDGQLQHPLRAAGRHRRAVLPGRRRSAVVGRLYGHGARAGRRGACSPLHADEHLPEDHGNLRRSGDVVQPRDPSASPAPRARKTCRCRATCAATIMPAPRTAAAAGGFNLGTASTNPDSSPPIRIRSARSIARCTSRWSTG